MISSREQQNIREFQKRREMMLKSYGACFLFLALGLAILLLDDSFPGLLGLSKLHWRALALAQLLSAIIFAVRGFKQYRCPVCKEIIRGNDKYYLGVLMDPGECPHCGTRLKE